MQPDPTTTPYARTNITRGCGRARTAGGIYLEIGLTPNGQPLEHYLLDPPIPHTVDSALGVSFYQDQTGTYHILDHVGTKHYPYPSDFLEEGRQHGFSRRINSTLIQSHFSKLSAASTLTFVHARAIVSNASEIYPYLPEHRLKHRCAYYVRSGNDEHIHDADLSCSRYWYALAPANRTGIRANGEMVPERAVTEDTSYSVEALPLETPEPTYESGIVARLPITAITVVTSPDGSHKRTLQRIRDAAGASGIPIAARPT